MATVKGEQPNKETIAERAYRRDRKQVIGFAARIMIAIEHEQWDDVIANAGRMLEPATSLLLNRKDERTDD